MLHGGIVPTSTHDKTRYNLTGALLPANTHLFAPSILGNSYYDHPESEDFIRKIHKEYIEQTGLRKDYITYCLDQIRAFEQDDVDKINEELEESYDQRRSEQRTRPLERDERLEGLDTVVHKSYVKWKKHTHRILEKIYFIPSAKDTPPNSIMFFCEDDLTFGGGFKELYQNPDEPTVYPREPRIKYVVEYDEESRICVIRFVNDVNVDLIPFDIIYEILSGVVLHVLPNHTVELSIFDFTCSEMIFPGYRHTDLTPVFLSSQKKDNRLVYGTIYTQRAKDMRTKWLELPYAYPGGDYERRSRAEFRPELSVSSRDTPSPARATHTLFVYLDEGITTFADFEQNPTVTTSTSRSIDPSLSPHSARHDLSAFFRPTHLSHLSPHLSPPPSPSPFSRSIERTDVKPGGSHRRHRRHRGVNKVSRKRGHRRNSRTTVRSKRKKTKSRR
jgi:hypothetical protein